MSRGGVMAAEGPALAGSDSGDLVRLANLGVGRLAADGELWNVGPA